MGKGKGTSCWYYFGGGQCGKCHGSGTCKKVKCVDCGGTGSKTGHIHGGTDPCSAQTCKRCNGEKYDPDAKGMDDRWCKECHGNGKVLDRNLEKHDQISDLRNKHKVLREVLSFAQPQDLQRMAQNHWHNIGDKVDIRSRWQDDTKITWYPAEIEGITDDGRYKVRFTDDCRKLSWWRTLFDKERLRRTCQMPRTDSALRSIAQEVLETYTAGWRVVLTTRESRSTMFWTSEQDGPDNHQAFNSTYYKLVGTADGKPMYRRIQRRHESDTVVIRWCEARNSWIMSRPNSVLLDQDYWQLAGTIPHLVKDSKQIELSATRSQDCIGWQKTNTFRLTPCTAEELAEYREKLLNDYKRATRKCIIV